MSLIELQVRIELVVDGYLPELRVTHRTVNLSDDSQNDYHYKSLSLPDTTGLDCDKAEDLVYQSLKDDILLMVGYYQIVSIYISYPLIHIANSLAIDMGMTDDSSIFIDECGAPCIRLQDDLSLCYGNEGAYIGR